MSTRRCQYHQFIWGLQHHDIFRHIYWYKLWKCKKRCQYSVDHLVRTMLMFQAKTPAFFTAMDDSDASIYAMIQVPPENRTRTKMGVEREVHFANVIAPQKLH